MFPVFSDKMNFKPNVSLIRFYKKRKDLETIFMLEVKIKKCKYLDEVCIQEVLMILTAPAATVDNYCVYFTQALSSEFGFRIANTD